MIYAAEELPVMNPISVHMLYIYICPIKDIRHTSIIIIYFLIGIVLWEVESSWVHLALRPPIHLLCQPQVFMIVEKLVEWWLAGEAEVLLRKPALLLLCSPQSPHVFTDANLSRRSGKPTTNCLSYGTANYIYFHSSIRGKKMAHLYQTHFFLRKTVLWLIPTYMFGSICSFRLIFS
jgi:hypothetical protein